MVPTRSAQPLKLLPTYLGVASLDEALQHPRITRILWLEILVNDAIDWTTLAHPLVQEAYRTACRWHTKYRTLISSLVSRTPLPKDPGLIDERLYRQFAEALEFVHTHP
ncbi:MAG: hypothetical protein E8D45_10655 [Nitrospira sp.]|nr:MAG: hypothetical protein E8D45_10655 [Nitrospira sp.]